MPLNPHDPEGGFSIASSVSSQCDLCGLPVRSDHFGADYGAKGTYRFCCAGCRMVFAMLMEMTDAPDPVHFKQTDLYHRCVAAGVVPASEADLAAMTATTPNNRSTEPVSTLVTVSDDVTLPVEQRIEGMWCPACAWVIDAVVMRIPGVSSTHCDFLTDRIRFRYHPAQVSPEQIRHAIERLGYRIISDDVDGTHSFLRRDFVRLSISALLSVNVMMLSWALYSGFFTTLSPDDVGYISWPIVIMATIVFLFGGGPLLQKAWAGIVHGAPGMEVLVMLGAGSAYLYSLFNWWAGSIHLYFDTATMLICLVLLGKLLEAQAKARVRQDLEGFLALMPKKVRLCTSAYPHGRFVSVAQLAVGDYFKVGPNDVLPADGRVVQGAGRMDLSVITGEAKPVTVMPGDVVSSGSRVFSGELTIEAERVGGQSLLGQMVAVVTQSLSRKGGLEDRWERLLIWFVPIIVVLALTTGLIVYVWGNPLDQAIIRSVTVLVIACPCALGIAVPLARIAGVSGAGRRGILVKDAFAFEKAGHIDTVVFDKTGTVTRAQWTVEQIVVAPDQSQNQMIALAMGLEAGSEHTIARSLAALGDQMDIEPAVVTDLQTHSQGVSGWFEGRMVRLGSRAFALAVAEGGDSAGGQSGLAGSDDTTFSEVVLSVDGAMGASFFFGDSLRDDMPYTVKQCVKRGLELYLVSGDDDLATQAVGRHIGIANATGRLLPQNKAEHIRALQNKGHYVAMVGDGVNDAPALAQADLSAAVHSAAPLAQHAAGITLMRGHPIQLLDFLDWAILVERTVRQNLWCALIYNGIAIPVAMMGLLTPLWAVSAMLLSSLTVIGNTLLLIRKDR